ncbi:MAG TPA: hypothetical protein VE288_00655 [Rubrobacteraceae bacterium]|nr:hypothetical protein [Rubrobacteraceae bacterium]
MKRILLVLTVALMMAAMMAAMVAPAFAGKPQPTNPGGHVVSAQQDQGSCKKNLPSGNWSCTH